MASNILTHQDIENKSRRIAYQIAEVFSDQDQLFLAGISGQGYKFAEILSTFLKSISNLEVTLVKIEMDKKNPLSPAKTDFDLEEARDGNLVLCDDVLNSGTTLIYAVQHFLQIPLKAFKTAVLVNRNHKKYPVKADFKGISLSTTMEEHIEVNLKSEPYSATLR